jgi:hypothetical protein
MSAFALDENRRASQKFFGGGLAHREQEKEKD